MKIILGAKATLEDKIYLIDIKVKESRQKKSDIVLSHTFPQRNLTKT